MFIAFYRPDHENPSDALKAGALHIDDSTIIEDESQALDAEVLVRTAYKALGLVYPLNICVVTKNRFKEFMRYNENLSDLSEDSTDWHQFAA